MNVQQMGPTPGVIVPTRGPTLHGWTGLAFLATDLNVRIRRVNVSLSDSLIDFLFKRYWEFVWIKRAIYVFFLTSLKYMHKTKKMVYMSTIGAVIFIITFVVDIIRQFCKYVYIIRKTIWKWTNFEGLWNLF